MTFGLPFFADIIKKFCIFEDEFLQVFFANFIYFPIFAVISFSLFVFFSSTFSDLFKIDALNSLKMFCFTIKIHC